MCLAIPAPILTIDPVADSALVSLSGVRRPVSLALVENAAVGDYVLVHVGYALNLISPKEAERTLALMKQAGTAEAGARNPDPNSESAAAPELPPERGRDHQVGPARSPEPAVGLGSRIGTRR